MTTRHYALRDDQWERIKDLLAGSDQWVGVKAKDNRLFVEKIPQESFLLKPLNLTTDLGMLY